MKLSPTMSVTTADRPMEPQPTQAISVRERRDPASIRARKPRRGNAGYQPQQVEHVILSCGSGYRRPGC